MLQFFRRYQKIFFVFVTVAIVISFLFFGTYSAMTPQAVVEDKELGKGLAGKPIRQQELNALCRLISSSLFDQTDKMVNLLNDGVIEKELISNGLSVLVAKKYFDVLRPELDKRVKKIKNYRPYVHPAGTQVSAEAIWRRFAPSFLEKYHSLKAKSDQATVESFALLSQVFLEQAALPSETLKQVLYMQQNQLGLPQDPLLAQADLSLFGFKNVEDWFGPRFVSIAAQIILNGAQVAESRGFVIPKEEVKENLFKNIVHGYRQISQEKALTAQEVENYYHHAAHHLGMDEQMLLSSWQKVMLYRRLMEDASGSILIDPLAFRQFEQFTKESVEIDLYQMPKSFQFADFIHLLKFQVYLEAIAKNPQNLRKDLHLPSEIASIEQIEKRAPELIQRSYFLEWTSVNKAELAQQISLKETRDWEVNDLNWGLLQRQFTELTAIKAEKKADRLQVLDQLESKARQKIDLFAREKMIDSRPERILMGLENASLQSKELNICAKGSVLPFGKENPELVSLLETAPLKGETANAVSERLRFYTPDQRVYYRIDVIERASDKMVLSFDQANKEGALDRILDARLEAAYPEVRKKSPRLFQDTSGQFRPYSDVKKEIGKIVFADLLKSIEETYQAHFKALPVKTEDLPLNFYSNARLLSHVNAGIPSQIPSDPLLQQWQLEKEKTHVERCSPLAFSKEEMFSLPVGSFSGVQVGDRGKIGFYCVQAHEETQQAPIESLDKGHQILCMDAKRDLFQQLLKQVQEKQTIDLSYSFMEDR